MDDCPQCNGTGLERRGVWIFKRVEHCNKCDGTGKIIVISKKKQLEIKGDSKRLQEVFHIMAHARKVASDRKKGDDFQLNRELRGVQSLLKEERYDEAKEKAQKALDMAKSL
ncbi:MAG TPA: hypothetical protein ENN76_02625 [Euryarchaeota archaeon]|nr:hypothetical protein [Euryarchaeota archaeon]